ncbi:iron-containing alcohol dehydrogenase family protein [Paenibacillus sp. WLX2291]|uniref:iron-containing alcohol dehydrogenase family protein n=1 Tax=Paenibacillus sp. WLX2291 TaxID=3296934 RepID=UPI003983E0ED
MITVKAPAVYRNERGLFKQSGELVHAIGNYALVIGGRRALASVRPSLLPSLEQAGVQVHVETFDGYSTRQEIESYTNIARQLQVNVIIGVGGGKVLDLSKAVAQEAGIPIVSVPTIPATCAAWSALTVLYDSDGQSAGYLPLNQSPALVLADPDVLSQAPRRYLAAGIGDTLVKWHEFAVNLNGNAGSLALRSSVGTAKLALDILERHALEVYEQAGNGQVTDAFTEVTDSIIVLAGLVGTIQDGSAHAAIAHGLHDSLTRLEETHDSLHGEKVAFGLLTQWVLEGKEPQELHRLASWLHQLDLPVTLNQLGIESDHEQAATIIANGLALREGAAQNLAFAVDAGSVKQAILRAHELGRSLQQHGDYTAAEQVLRSISSSH